MYAPPAQDIVQKDDRKCDLKRGFNDCAKHSQSVRALYCAGYDKDARQKVKNIPIGSKLATSLVTRLLILPTKFLPFSPSSKAFDGSGFLASSSDGAFPFPFGEEEATVVLEIEAAERGATFAPVSLPCVLLSPPSSSLSASTCDAVSGVVMVVF